MKSTLLFRYGGLFMFVILLSHFSSAQKKMTPKRITELKQEAANLVDEKAKMSQVMVDKIFSFAELGFQEVKSSSYLTGILKENGFEMEMGVSGIPTAWFAIWSNWGKLSNT